MTKKEPRSFWQLLPRERNEAYRLAEEHEDALWEYSLEQARAPANRRTAVADEFCARLRVTREQLGWMQDANLQRVLGGANRRVLHRVK